MRKQLTAIGAFILVGMSIIIIMGIANAESKNTEDSTSASSLYITQYEPISLPVQESDLKVETPLPSQVDPIQVPAISQNPELYDGCEVTSVAMMLQQAGYPVDKMELADKVEKDPTELESDENGKIVSWGDPNVGFVGDISGASKGFGVYHGPIKNLIDQILPGKSLDLTDQPFDAILQQLINGKTVVVWTNATFASVDDSTEWQSENGPVHALWSEHAVLLVGYSEDQIYLNDPLDGVAAKSVDKKSFIASWEQMGKQAVSYHD